MKNTWSKNPWLMGLALGLGAELGYLLAAITRVRWRGEEFALDWLVMVGYFVGFFIGGYVATHIRSRIKDKPA